MSVRVLIVKRSCAVYLIMLPMCIQNHIYIISNACFGIIFWCVRTGVRVLGNVIRPGDCIDMEIQRCSSFISKEMYMFVMLWVMLVFVLLVRTASLRDPLVSHCILPFKCMYLPCLSLTMPSHVTFIPNG